MGQDDRQTQVSRGVRAGKETRDTAGQNQTTDALEGGAGSILWGPRLLRGRPSLHCSSTLFSGQHSNLNIRADFRQPQLHPAAERGTSDPCNTFCPHCICIACFFYPENCQGEGRRRRDHTSLFSVLLLLLPLLSTRSFCSNKGHFQCGKKGRQHQIICQDTIST